MGCCEDDNFIVLVHFVQEVLQVGSHSNSSLDVSLRGDRDGQVEIGLLVEVLITVDESLIQIENQCFRNHITDLLLWGQVDGFSPQLFKIRKRKLWLLIDLCHGLVVVNNKQALQIGELGLRSGEGFPEHGDVV
jgi:hypothetical protein